MKNVTTFPVGTTAERNTLTPIANSLFCNLDTKTFQLFDGVQWNDIQGYGPIYQAPRIATTTPITVDPASDFIVGINLAVAGASVVNLPPAVDGQVFCIKDAKGDAAVNFITINANGADRFENGVASIFDDKFAFGSYTFIAKSGVWYGLEFT